MKNKLLLSTAIASVAFAGFASAETKISGNLEQTFNALSSDTSIDSRRAFGAEQNISLSSSKELDNGLTASYGFTFEGDQAVSADSHQLVVGTDTVQVGFFRDAGLNLSGSALPYVGDQVNTAAFTGLTSLNALINDSDVHDNDYAALHLNAVGGTFAFQYAPDIVGGNDDSDLTESANSAMGLIYKGSLGVDGLNVLAGKTTSDGTGAEQDIEEVQYGASYSFGQFQVGAEQSKQDNAESTDDIKITQFGVAAAATDNFSIGLYHTKTEAENDSSLDDEKVKMVQVGYNLGGLGFTVSYADIENVGGTNGSDAEQLQIRTIQKF